MKRGIKAMNNEQKIQLHAHCYYIYILSFFLLDA